MGWGELALSDASAGTTGQIDKAHQLLDYLKIQSGPLAVRVVEVVDVVKKLRGPTEKEDLCIVEDKMQYNCIVCDKRVHGAQLKCTCSGYREKDFYFASLCTNCCVVYDRLMEDEALQAVLQKLFKKYYYDGRGPVIDF